MFSKIILIFTTIVWISSNIFAESLVVQLMHQNRTPGKNIFFNIYGINGNSFQMSSTTNSSGISRIQLPNGSYKIKVINKVENITIFPNEQNHKVIIIP